ncbi:Alpha/Beta hydrolase protein [Mortierella sp. GBAus27b]|nr:Alpha/Beta hydrolase protein [Mortierella sp. GBAus27b]
MLDTMEKTKGIKFSKTHNPNIECIRLAFDPVVASHRPLIYYTVILLYFLGFSRFEGTVDQSAMPYNYDSSTDLSYWCRVPTQPDNKVPLVFIHGIGVGLVQYAHWIIALSTISRPIILVEIPYVANNPYKVDCMSPDDTYLALERILKRHGYSKATFMGHSLGTMICAAICRANSATSPKSIVHGMIIADPICFLTHHSIARNFAYRPPSTANELLMDLFAAREIGTSWYIMRRFCWNQSIMFPFSPVLPKMTRVFLSREDNLLDMGLVVEYLKSQVGLSEERGELHVMEDLDHAAFLLRPSWFLKVLKAAEEC